MEKLEQVHCFICTRRLLDAGMIGVVKRKCDLCKNIIKITGEKNSKGLIEYKQEVA